MRSFISPKQALIATSMVLLSGLAFAALRAVPDRGDDDCLNDHSAERGHGRRADVPEEIPIRGLRDVLWRVIHEVFEDRVTLIAAGVTFYLLLGLFPALSALVALYGLIADPATMADQLRELSGLLPPGAFDLIADRIHILAATSNSSLGITFFLGLGVALWSTHSAILAIFEAMNVAYEESEKRGMVRLNLVGLGFTICAMFVATLMIALVAILPIALSYLWLDQFKEEMALLVRWPILLIISCAATTAIYRFGPSREPARFRWVTWGAGLVTVLWFAMSIGFSFYLDNFANYNASYGSLGALIGFLVWMWLSIVILIVGGELNAELEHQTAKDTTTGSPLPLGFRGAYVADTIGKSAN